MSCDGTPWDGFWPYAAHIPGQLILMAFYAVILALGAKCIADGSEMLMEVRFHPNNPQPKQH
jgi:hypothetical protein